MSALFLLLCVDTVLRVTKALDTCKRDIPFSGPCKFEGTLWLTPNNQWFHRPSWAHAITMEIDENSNIHEVQAMVLPFDLQTFEPPKKKPEPNNGYKCGADDADCKLTTYYVIELFLGGVNGVQNVVPMLPETKAKLTEIEEKIRKLAIEKYKNSGIEQGYKVQSVALNKAGVTPDKAPSSTDAITLKINIEYHDKPHDGLPKKFKIVYDDHEEVLDQPSPQFKLHDFVPRKRSSREIALARTRALHNKPSRSQSVPQLDSVKHSQGSSPMLQKSKKSRSWTDVFKRSKSQKDVKKQKNKAPAQIKRSSSSFSFFGKKKKSKKQSISGMDDGSLFEEYFAIEILLFGLLLLIVSCIALVIGLFGGYVLYNYIHKKWNNKNKQIAPLICEPVSV